MVEEIVDIVIVEGTKATLPPAACVVAVCIDIVAGLLVTGSAALSLQPASFRLAGVAVEGPVLLGPGASLVRRVVASLSLVSRPPAVCTTPTPTLTIAAGGLVVLASPPAPVMAALGCLALTPAAPLLPRRALAERIKVTELTIFEFVPHAITILTLEFPPPLIVCL